MGLSLEHPLAVVNGTKDPVGENQKLWYGQAGTGGHFGGWKDGCIARKASSRVPFKCMNPYGREGLETRKNRRLEGGIGDVWPDPALPREAGATQRRGSINLRGRSFAGTRVTAPAASGFFWSRCKGR